MGRVSKDELHKTIYEIMATSDLNHLTTKRIRLLCEAKYRVDLTSRKAEIDEIVMEYVNRRNGETAASNRPPAAAQGRPPATAAQSRPAETQSRSAEAAEQKDETSSEEEESEDSSDESESCSGSDCSGSSEEEEEEEEEEQNKPSASAPKKEVPAKPSASASAPKKEIPAKAAVKKEKPIKTLPPKKSYLKKEANQAMKRPPSPPPEEAQPAKKDKKETTGRLVNICMQMADDAAYARQLQAEEWNLRKRNNRRSFRDNPIKKDNKNNEKKKKATAFTRKCLLSPTLAEVLGTDEMSRPDIVQKMWAVVRERNLFDSSNKQYALCDEQLTRLFGRKRVRLIGMMKYLKKHIKDVH